MEPPPTVGSIKSTPAKAPTTLRTCNPTTTSDEEVNMDNIGHWILNVVVYGKVNLKVQLSLRLHRRHLWGYAAMPQRNQQRRERGCQIQTCACHHQFHCRHSSAKSQTSDTIFQRLAEHSCWAIWLRVIYASLACWTWNYRGSGRSDLGTGSLWNEKWQGVCRIDANCSHTLRLTATCRVGPDSENVQQVVNRLLRHTGGEGLHGC